MQNVDFDVGQYSPNELANFFNLGANWNIGDVELSTKAMLTKVQKGNNSFDYDLHNNDNLIAFILEASQCLIEEREREREREREEKVDRQREKGYKENEINDALNTNTNTNNTNTNINAPPIETITSHDVQTMPTIPVANTYQYSFPTGIVNPIERRIITKVINIDSLFREDQFNASNSFVWSLPSPQINVISMKVVALELPIVWHMFTAAKKNNVFTVTLYNVMDVSTGQVFSPIVNTVIIPNGNYLSDDFVTLMNNVFQNMGNGMQYLEYTISIATASSVIRAANAVDADYILARDIYNPLSPNYSPNFYFVLDFAPDATTFNKAQNAGWLMGFRNHRYTVRKQNLYTAIGYAVPAPIFFAYVASEGDYGNSLYNYVFLRVDDFNRNYIVDAITSSNQEHVSIIGDNILARITVTNGFNAVLNDNGGDRIFKTREYMGPVRINKLKISLVDKYGDLVTMHTNNFSFALELAILY